MQLYNERIVLKKHVNDRQYTAIFKVINYQKKTHLVLVIRDLKVVFLKDQICDLAPPCGVIKGHAL